MVSFPALVREATVPYSRELLAAVGIFAFGIIVGVGVVAADVDLLGLLGIDDLAELFPEELSALDIFVNNLQAAGLMIIGGLTLGLLTAYALFANGVLIGFVVTPAVAETELLGTLLLLVPHGVFELPAIFIAAAIGFRIALLLTDRLRGRRERFRPDRPEQRRLGVLAGVAVGLLVVAAVIEVYVTPTLFEAVYGTDPVTE